MSEKQTLIVTAVMSIVTALLMGTCFGMLGAFFGYPEIIRETPQVLLTRLYEQRHIVPYLYYGLGIAGVLIVFTALLIHESIRIFGGSIFSVMGRVSGVIVGVLLFTGILRYVVLFPYLADQYMNGNSEKETLILVFQSFQYHVGVCVTEHAMFFFLSLMLVFFSVALLKTGRLGRWTAIFGIATAVLLFYGNFELFDVPYAFSVNRLASKLSGVWLIFLGITIIRFSMKQYPRVLQQTVR
ncbi:MAG: DUF4386 family protein [Deltaproteobacteria bacterium]|nr:DUF4386 family protein [Deltaproteobacteria bacterium]